MDDENYKVTFSAEGKNFAGMYRFSVIHRELSEFNLMCRYHQTSPESHFTRKQMCTIAKTDGRITLSGLKLIETNKGVRSETLLKNDIEFNEKLRDLFGIDLSQY
jgi:N-hydroxyarylamine O-acetyltransferase